MTDPASLAAEARAEPQDIITALWGALDSLEAYLLDRRDNDEGAGSGEYAATYRTCADRTLRVLNGARAGVARDANQIMASRWAEAKRASDRLDAYAALEAQARAAGHESLEAWVGAMVGKVAVPIEPTETAIRAVDRACHEHWPSARKMAVAMYTAMIEAALSPAIAKGGEG